MNHSIKLQTPDTAALKRARQCHDHLGGELACELYQRLLAAGWIEQHDQRIRVTSVGAQRFAERGLFIQALVAAVVPAIGLARRDGGFQGSAHFSQRRAADRQVRRSGRAGTGRLNHTVTCGRDAAGVAHGCRQVALRLNVIR